MIIIGCDHTGHELKNKIKEYLTNNNIQYLDVCNNANIDNTDDYPDIAELICKEVLRNENNYGIAICGTGIGISIASNKIKNIRASVINNPYLAEISRKHNDLNVLCLGAREDYVKDIQNLENIINKFINTKFEGQRHKKRIEKINKLESKYGN